MKNYINVPSDNYFCVGAVLESILKKHGYFEYDQFDIVNEFGLVVPKDANLASSIKNIHHSKSPSEWGVNLNKNSINDFFEKNNIALFEEYISIKTIADYEFESTLKDIPEDFDVIFGFDYGRLFNIPDSFGVGHVGIFLIVENGNVKYLDPGPKNRGIREIKVDDLYSAIKSKSDGLWIIKPKQNNKQE